MRPATLPTVLACLLIASVAQANDAAALPPEAQKLVDKAEAQIAAVRASEAEQIARIKGKAAKELQQLLHAALKKGDQEAQGALTERIEALTKEVAASASGGDAGPQIDWSAVPGGLSWVDATADLGGAKWGYGGVHSMAVMPGSDLVIAGVSDVGAWGTTDGGVSWKKLGAQDGHQIGGRPIQFVFDPKKPSTFWVCCSYGDALFRSDDGGATFTALGSLKHADGISVDFSDPNRQTLLMGMHEQARSLQLSTDGGKNWTRIGDKLPEKSNFTDAPLIIDTKTFLTNTSGWGGGLTGIWRSEDAGTTWTQVSTIGPSGKATVGPDGTIFWLGGGGLLRSADQGRTWKASGGPARVRPIVVDRTAIADASDSQLQLSSDGGMTWKAIGGTMPIKPDGIVYNAKRRSFFAYHLGQGGANSVIRLDLKAGP